MKYAVDNNVAPFISTSYGYCESPTIGVKLSQAQTYQTWAKQALAHGQTIVAASGDSGAADCESSSSTSATTGFAVDIPAAIPEVTGAGGNAFTADSGTCPSSTCPGGLAPADPPYWAASNAGSDVISTRWSTSPRWRGTTPRPPSPAILRAAFLPPEVGPAFTSPKPTWQTGTGVPADGKRDVPDISVSASNFHDPYLVCSEDGDTTPCASGFRDSVGGSFFAVGGTSAAAPTLVPFSR